MMNFFKQDIRRYTVSEPSFLMVIYFIMFKSSYQTVMFYRLAFACRKRKVLKPIAVIIDYLSTIITSCHISSKANIGSGFLLPHATSVVIGEGVIIGKGCTIFQSVTIGLKGIGEKHYPKIGDNVTLSAGCVVLGGIEVGTNSIVGANSTVLNNVPEDSVVVGSPARVL